MPTEAKSGMRKKMTTAREIERPSMAACAQPDISSSSFPSSSIAALAENINALSPRVSVSARTMMPRTRGRLRSLPV